MDMNKFKQKAVGAISAAQEAAVRMGRRQIDGEHLHYVLATLRDWTCATYSASAT